MSNLFTNSTDFSRIANSPNTLIMTDVQNVFIDVNEIGTAEWNYCKLF